MYILFAYIKNQEENKMKKILALILALAVILSLGGLHRQDPRCERRPQQAV